MRMLVRRLMAMRGRVRVVDVGMPVRVCIMRVVRVPMMFMHRLVMTMRVRLGRRIRLTMNRELGGSNPGPRDAVGPDDTWRDRERAERTANLFERNAGV